jgi:mannitol-1-phosphate 5-dehydrogenase
VFVDVSETVVAELNRGGSYPLRLVTKDSEEVRQVCPVRGILASDTDAVVAALSTCSFAATAVGIRHIENVARTLVQPCLQRRGQPLNVLLCENGLTVRESFLAGIDTQAGGGIGAVETVIGRMVPEPKYRSDDPLGLSAEPFRELPFNRSQWNGDVPNVPGLIPVDGKEFLAYELRKLFLHNGGHALLAYHGYLHGHSDIHTCAMDDALVTELRGFWSEMIAALRRSEQAGASIFASGRLEAFTEDLLDRFRNPHLGDTVLRVARDPLRKLARNERLVGAALFCEKHGVEPRYVSRAIAAALRFDDEADPGAVSLQQSLSERGLMETLTSYSGIGLDSLVASLVGQEFAGTRVE